MDKMGRKASDLILENKGRCFLCSHRVSPHQPQSSIVHLELKQATDSFSVLTDSFQCLTRYLDMDLRKVFVSDGSIPSNLLEKVHKSILKVELCKECSSVNKKFSELHQKLEKITMEVGAQLRVIMRKLQKVDEKDDHPDQSQNAQMMTCLDELIVMQKAEIVKTMRKEVKEKCCIKLKILSPPRVRVQKLSVKEITGEMDRLKRDSLKDKPPSPPVASSSKTTDSESVPVALFKTELGDFEEDPDFSPMHSIADTSCDLDETQHLSDGEDDDIEISHSPSLILKQKQRSGKTLELRGKYIIDAKTDAHTCRDCSTKFVSFPAFYLHYKREHLKIIYKCSACKKIFTQVSSLNRHQKVVHKSLKFKCEACNQLFSLESLLSKHRTDNVCKPKDMFEEAKSASMIILRPPKFAEDVRELLENSWDPQKSKHICGICSKECDQKGSLRDHYRRQHAKIQYKCGLCQKIFPCRYSYRRHHTRVHLQLECPKCRKLFTERLRLTKHLQNVRACKAGNVSKGPITETEIEINKALVVIRHGETSKFQCSLCSNEFSSNEAFRQHYMKTHLNTNDKHK